MLGVTIRYVQYVVSFAPIASSAATVAPGSDSLGAAQDLGSA
jgi:hypothetical protein